MLLTNATWCDKTIHVKISMVMLGVVFWRTCMSTAKWHGWISINVSKDSRIMYLDRLKRSSLQNGSGAGGKAMKPREEKTRAEAK